MNLGETQIFQHFGTMAENKARGHEQTPVRRTTQFMMKNC